MSDEDRTGPLSPVPKRFMDTTDEKLAVIISDLKDIKPQVNETNKAVVGLQVDMRNMGERVSKVEERVEKGHDCHNIEVIAELKTSAKEQSTKFITDAREDAQQAEKIRNLAKEAAALEADVDDIRKGPRRMFYGLIAIVVTLMSSAGMAVWFLSGLNTELKEERLQRAEQIKTIRAEIDSVGVIADPTPLKTEVSELREVVQTSNGHAEEYNAQCEGMSEFEKRFWRDTLIKRGRRIPESCFQSQEE